MKMQRSSGVSGPSSALGIMRFFDSDSKAPKISPEFIMVLSVLFVVAMILWHAFA